MSSISTLLIVQYLKASLEFFIDTIGLTLEEEYEDSIKLKCGQHSLIIYQGTKVSIEYEHGFNSNSTLLITVSYLDKKNEELKSKGVVFIHKRTNKKRWGHYT